MIDVTSAPISGVFMDFKVFEATPGFSVVVLPDHPTYTLVAVTNDFVKTSGMKREDVIGKGHFEVFPYGPKDIIGAQNLRTSFQHTIASKEPHTIPLQRSDIVNGEGSFSERYWKISNAPVLNDKDEVIYIVHSAVDVSEQVKGEQRESHVKAIEKQNEELRYLMNWMPQMVWDSRADGSASFFNQVYLDYTGSSSEELNGDKWTRLLHPDDVAKTRELWTQALMEGSDYVAEHRIRGKDGSYCWFLSRSRPVKNTEGEVVRWYGTATNIQQFKELQETLDYQNMLFRTMTDNATSTLFMMDKTGHCTFMNANGERMFGYSQEEIRSKPLHYLIHHHRPDGSFYPMEQCPIDRALPENFDVRAHRDLFFRKDGSSFPVTCAASPIFEDGVPVSTVIEVRDITLELEAEQTLRKSASELEQLVQQRTEELQEVNEQLQQFAYAASHDLQEPLRKINFFIDRLKSNLGALLDQQNGQIIERIYATSARMKGLIDDLLNYSNATLGATAFNTVDLNRVVEGVLSDMEATIIEKEPVINIQELPAIKGDERQLRQLFQNLVSNALKYNKPGQRPELVMTATIVSGFDEKISLPYDRRKGNFYKIEVTDKGIGFEQEHADKIFQVFQRLHGRSEYPGTGVGLAIVKKVVENHSGCIWAKSNPGEGASFYLLFPVE